MQRSISGSDFSSGFRLIRNDIFFDFLDNPETVEKVGFKLIFMLSGVEA